MDKSLLQTVPTDPEQEPRFRMLETLREYGAERLGDADAIAGIRRLHARYFRDLAEDAEPHLRRAEQLVWLLRLNAERDNLFAALRFAADDGDADTAVRIAAALAWYWTLGDQGGEGRMWMRVALDTPGESSVEARAIVQILAKIMAVFEDEQWERAHLLEAELNELSTGIDSAHPILALVDAIGPMLSDNRERLAEAVAKHENHPDPWVAAMLHLMRGMSAENAGDRAGVHVDLEEARRRFTELGDRWGMSATLNGLAALAVTEGDDARALELQTEALELIRDINALSDAAQIQMMRALILTRLGDNDTALRLLEEILDTGIRNGSEITMFLGHLGLSEHHRLNGRTELGWHYLHESEAHTDAGWHGPPQVIALRDVSAALLHLSDGDLGAARGRLVNAWSHGLLSHDMPVQARIASATACYAYATGDPRSAARLLGCGERLLGTADRSDMDRTLLLDNLHAELSADVFESCYAEGRNAKREESQALLAAAIGVPSPVGGG